MVLSGRAGVFFRSESAELKARQDVKTWFGYLDLERSRHLWPREIKLARGFISRAENAGKHSGLPI